MRSKQRLRRDPHAPAAAILAEAASPSPPARNPASGSPSAPATTLAAEFGLPALDLRAFDQTRLPDGVVDAELASRHNVLPLAQRGQRLFVAVADPANLPALDEIKLRTGLDVEAVLVEAQALADALAHVGDRAHTLLADLDGEVEEGSAILRGLGKGSDKVDEAPIVKYIDKVLKSAAAAGASDIHFEPFDGFYRIRVRRDGVLRETERPPAHLGARFAARLKVMAQLDITERRLPQDGRIQVRRDAAGGLADLRISTLPTMHGEKVVLRVLDPATGRLGVEQLGLEEDQKRRYLHALSQPQGLVLVTGPTGSGKTVSLYAGLGLLNEEERNIATAEDPVEIDMPGINQVQVNAQVGLDFATALRAFLRQDPDIVMVGEIRDVPTAETAIKAAQTGHLVLSTLHTNSAAETLTRLRNMGVPAFNVASTVTLIMAQRLARLLCRRCRRPVKLPAQALAQEGLTASDLASAAQLFDANPAGCAHCDRGYRGRIGIHEVVDLSPRLQRLILDGASSLELREAMRELGYDDLRRSGLKKAMRGQTSLAEVNRVTVRRDASTLAG